MKQILERTVAQMLKSIGFEGANKQAIELLTKTLEDRIVSTLSTINAQAILSSKPSCSLVDFFDAIKRLVKKKKSKLIEFKDLWDLLTIPQTTYEHEILKQEEEWISPVSVRVEKHIHIYDFMPQFPPIHTFRQTLLKQQATKNQSSKVKNRLEQSLRSEANMIKLIKSSGSIPGFINYLYKRKK